MTPRALVPALSLVLATLAAILPWRLPAEIAPLPQLLPVMVAVHWAARQPQWLAEWAVAVAGLTVDAMTQAPLGLWALTCLIGYSAGFVQGRLLPNGGAFDRFASVVGFAIAGLAAQLIMTVYAWAAIDYRPLALSVGIVAGAYLMLGLASVRGFRRLPASEG